MQAGLDALKTALRVLTAVTEHRDPEQADIQALLSYAPLLIADPARRIGLRGDSVALGARGRVRAFMAEGKFGRKIAGPPQSARKNGTTIWR